MTTRTAIALVLLLALAPACEDGDDCEINFDDGDLDAKVCEAVGAIVDCIEERQGTDVDEVPDEQLDGLVEACHTELKVHWCSDDSRNIGLVKVATLGEIRGETNDCVGGG